MKAKKEAEEENSSIEEFLTDRNIITNLSDVFMAGMETTASTLCWTLLYLLHNPGVQQMLHQELDQVIGPDCLPELEDKNNLPYLEASVAEKASRLLFRRYSLIKGRWIRLYRDIVFLRAPL